MNEVGDVEIWWYRTVLTGRAVKHNRPDVIVIDRGKKTWTLVDFSVPLDKNIVSKENEKIEKYGILAREVRRIYRVSTKIVPVVVGALGTIPKRLGGFGGVGYSGCEREHADHCIARDSTNTKRRAQPLAPGKEPRLSLISDWGSITNCPSVVSQLRERQKILVRYY